MTRRKVIWHIGPADPGTSFLAEALEARASELASLGVAVPTGAWHEIEDQIWNHKGVSVLSTPEIARAEADKIALRLVGLRDLEVHLVLLARDLPTQVYAAWQSSLQHGGNTPLKKYAGRVLDPAREHWQAEDFWAGHDLATILPAFTRAFHADRVHIIATDADADGVWNAFLAVAGIDGITRPDVYTPPSLKAELDPERVLDITTVWVDQLLQGLETAIEENLGMAMVFTLVSAVKEAAEQLVEDRKQAAAKEHEEAVLAAEREENKKFHGTPVNRETFLKWRDQFLKEMEEARLKEEEERTAELKKAKIKEPIRLTGKQLWERGLATAGQEDGDEDGVPSEDVQKLKVGDN